MDAWEATAWRMVIGGEGIFGGMGMGMALHWGHWGHGIFFAAAVAINTLGLGAPNAT